MLMFLCTFVRVWMHWPASRLPSLYLPLLLHPSPSLSLSLSLNNFIAITLHFRGIGEMQLHSVQHNRLHRSSLVIVNSLQLFIFWVVYCCCCCDGFFVSIRSTFLSSLIFSEPYAWVSAWVSACADSLLFQWAATNNFQSAHMHTMNYLTLPHCCCQVYWFVVCVRTFDFRIISFFISTD